MNYPSIILAVLGIAALAGLVTAYYKRSAGMETIELLKANNEALKEAIQLKDTKIASMQVQLQTKDDVIERLAKNGHKN